MESRKNRYQLDRLPLVLLIASLAVTVVAGQQLKAVYDDKEGYKLFPLAKPLMLTCITELTSDADKVVWSKMVEVDGKDGKDDTMVLKNVNEISDLKGRYQIIPKEGKFIIENSKKEDSGNYTCSLGNLSYKFNAYSTVAVKVAPNSYVIEEEKLELKCIVKGTEPKISWEFKPDNENQSKAIDADDRIKFEEYQDVEDAMLIIEKAQMSDRGTYTCIGRNELMTDDEARSESFVRVKDKLAALWPFLGICAEVFLLCAIILIYEKRRNKTDLDESDTDQSPDQKNDHKDSDVRHRK